jgi:iron complex outermembrane receptor protein
LTYASPPVSPEILDAYQAGVKSELADHRVRLNATAFYYRYKDIQVEEIVAGSVTSLNAAAAEMKGLDIDAEYVPLESLTLRAGIETLNGHYTNFHNAPFNNPALDPAGRSIGGNVTSSGDATGFATVRSPKLTANLSAGYRIPIAVGRLDLSMTYYYNDGFAWDPDNRLRQAHYNLLSASAGWSSPTDTFGARLWGKNLTGARTCSFEEAISLGDICSNRLGVPTGTS